MEERWSKIADLPEYFEISDQGRIRNISNPDSIQYGRTTVSSGGYLTISIRGKQYAIHRLVAQAFVENPNPENFKIVRHKDRVRTNNCASNLIWTSNAEAAKCGLKAKLENVDRIYCVELDALFQTLVTASFYTAIPEKLISHGIKNNCKICGLTFKSVSASDPCYKDTKAFYIEISDAINLGVESKSVLSFQAKMLEFFDRSMKS